MLRFDFAVQTKTAGRLYEGKQLVDIGSKREAGLLAMMRRAAALRRRWLGEAAAEDYSLSRLEGQLEAYVERFHDGK